MKVLLINPNRYHNPPVPPLSLEYLRGALEVTGHECRILDLCFAEDVFAALNAAVEDFAPGGAGITVRNIDNGMFTENRFFLDEIRELTSRLKALGVPAVAGGAGFSFNPRGVLEYLGARWGVSGPGERALGHLLDALEDGPPAAGTILDGWQWGADPELAFASRGEQLDYRTYLDQGGLAGFETQKGCYGTCYYCMESTGRVIFRKPESILRELKALAGRGVYQYHLCDSEFNQDLAFCREFLQALIASGLKIEWALYLKSTPYDPEFFRLLGRSGANLVTLSLPTGPDGLRHAAQIKSLAKKNGIRLAVDYLCGFPGDTPEKVRRDLEELKKIHPDTVGLNSYIRLYRGAVPLEACPPEERKFLFGAVEDNHGLIRPVFYSTIGVETLREIAGGDPLFKFEGFEQTSNYQRLNGPAR